MVGLPWREREERKERKWEVGFLCNITILLILQEIDWCGDINRDK